MSGHITSGSIQRETEPHQYLVWLVLIFGGISGTSSYFILRFIEVLTWYILAPIFYASTYVCMYIVISYNWRNSSSNENKFQFRKSLKYSGTWILIFFVFGTAMFLFGW